MVERHLFNLDVNGSSVKMELEVWCGMNNDHPGDLEFRWPH